MNTTPRRNGARFRSTAGRAKGDVPVKNIPSAADVCLSRKEIHEARTIRDAERRDPGVVRRTVDAAVAAGKEPTKARIRKAIAKAPPARGKVAVRQSVKDAVDRKLMAYSSEVRPLPAAG
jgi:hypothetical protein